jgi:hypothetical protein
VVIGALVALVLIALAIYAWLTPLAVYVLEAAG